MLFNDEFSKKCSKNTKKVDLIYLTKPKFKHFLSFFEMKKLCYIINEKSMNCYTTEKLKVFYLLTVYDAITSRNQLLVMISDVRIVFCCALLIHCLLCKKSDKLILYTIY